MWSAIRGIVRKPFEWTGLVSHESPEYTDEELRLLKRYLDLLEEDVDVFEEHTGFVSQLSSNALEIIDKGRKWVYKLEINDRFTVGNHVAFKVYKTANNVVVKDVQLVSVKGKFETKNVHGTITEVDGRKYKVSNNLNFDLVSISSHFIPMLGDSIIVIGDYPKDKEDAEAFDLDPAFFIVKRITPDTTRLVSSGTITSFNPQTNMGVILNYIIFHISACDKYVPAVGDHVACNVIQGHYENGIQWRALDIELNKQTYNNKRHFFVVTPVPKFSVVIGETKTVELCLSNHSRKLLKVRDKSQNSNDIIRILPTIPVRWPVEVRGDKLGHCRKVVEFEVIPENGRPFPASSRMNYEVIEQDLGKAETLNNSFARIPVVISGHRSNRKPTFRRVPIKEYLIPENLRPLFETADVGMGILDKQISLQQLKPSMALALNPKNYGDWMHTLLFLEELAEEAVYSKLATQAHLYRSRGFIMFQFEQESNYKTVVCGDSMIASVPWNTDVCYEGKVWEISSTNLYCRFDRAFEDSMHQGALHKLKFKMNRMPCKRQHQAVDLVLQNIGEDWLFPSIILDDEEELERNKVVEDLDVQFINRSLNAQQKSAIKNILCKRNMPHPYIVYGPPGTGKTMTLVEAILQVYVRDPNCHILVSAPTNSAVDTLGVRLLSFGAMNKEDMVRLSSYNSYSQGKIAIELIDISQVPHLGDPSWDSPIPEDREQPPTMYLDALGKHKITIGTQRTLAILNSAGLVRGYFTHIIIDEAGQCHEPDTLLSIALVDPEKTQLVLAGDPMQLGPTINSMLAKQYNFNRSLLDRFTSAHLYRKKIDYYESTCGYNPRLITRLVYNYRSLPQIVDLISTLYYENDLLPTIAAQGSREAEVLKKISINGYSLESRMNSLIFINVDSREEQEEGNQSWFNSGEVVQVLQTLNALYAADVAVDDIGVITPYSLQVKKIAQLLDSLNIYQPKIASVEEFQGQERDVIILSLVRNNLGISKKLSPFVTDGQRINVALSRARTLNIIIGNRNTLSASPMWLRIISKCHVLNFINQEPKEMPYPVPALCVKSEPKDVALLY